MSNEEKILEILDKLTKEVGRNSSLLEKQGRVLEEHSALLEKQGRVLGEHSALLEELDDRSLRSAVMLENEVLPKLQLLYEGHVHLQETLAPKERVEVLEDEVITLKSAVKMMAKRLDALEKAQ